MTDPQRRAVGNNDNGEVEINERSRMFQINRLVEVLLVKYIDVSGVAISLEL